MLISYSLVVDIISLNPTISEQEFRSQVEPCLSYLDSLKGSFDRSPCTHTYYPPASQNEKNGAECWAVRGIVMISLGKQRAYYLIELYKAISQLITLELPDGFDVKIEITDWKFS